MSDFDGVTIVMRLGKAVNVDIVDADQARDYIEQGTLRRETMVTVYRGDAASMQIAENVTCLSPLFEAVLGAKRPEGEELRPTVAKPAEAVVEPPEALAPPPVDPKPGPWSGGAPTIDLTEARARIEAAAAVIASQSVPPKTVTAAPVTPVQTVAPVTTPPRFRVVPKERADKKPGNGCVFAIILIVIIFAIRSCNSGSSSAPATTTTDTTTTETSPPTANLDAVAPQASAAVDTPAPAVSVAETPTAPTYATSFDCTKATALDEQLICRNENLAAADVALSRAYLTVIAQLRGRNRAEVVAGQHDWWRKRGVCITTVDPAGCLTDHYSTRQSQLQAIIDAIAAPAAAVRPSLYRNDDSGPSLQTNGIVCLLPSGGQVTLPLDQCRERDGVRIGG